jgi:phosphoglycolate phosphatase-like HAD superfamily hydrolase
MSVLHKPGAPITLNRFVSQPFIAMLKTSGLNTNWDLAYFSAALYLIELIAEAKPRGRAKELFEAPFSPETLRGLGLLIGKKRRLIEPIETLFAYFTQFRKKREKARPAACSGPADLKARTERFIDDINAWRLERTGIDAPVFARSGPLWDLCTALFQQRYLGDNLFLIDNDSCVSEIPKGGMIQDERPVIPAGKVISTLAMLKEAGLRLGVATGRPYDEIMIPLKRWGVFHFFDKDSVATHREIAEAEEFLLARGQTASIAKPHPYVYLRAIFPEKSIGELLDMKLPLPESVGGMIIIVGDTMSDLIATRTIGARAAVVLTGVKSLIATSDMVNLDPEFVLNDISEFEKLF